MRPTLERLELLEASAADIRKHIATYAAKRRAWVASRGFGPEVAAGYATQIEKDVVELTKRLKAYWAGSRKVDREIKAIRQGDMKVDVEKTSRAIDSLERRARQYDLQRFPNVDANVERLYDQWRQARESYLTIKRERMDTRTGAAERDAYDAKRRSGAAAGYDRELRGMRGRRR